MVRTLILAVMVAVSVVSLDAQQNSSLYPPVPPPVEIDNQQIPPELTPGGSYKPSATLRKDVHYDKFKDETIVTLEHGIDLPFNSGSGLSWLSLRPVFTCDGNHPLCVPEEVTLHFFAAGSRWNFMKDHELILMVDGRRLPLSTRWDGETSTGTWATLEYIDAEVSYRTFVEIIRGKRVEGELGSRMFEVPAAILPKISTLFRAPEPK